MSGGGNRGTVAEGPTAAASIPAGSRKIVQSLKEIVNSSEAEIYAMLKECNMDPSEAVRRLLSQDLTSKKCVPCNSKDIQPMSFQSANELLPQVQGWNLSSEGGIMKLHRSWKAKSFTKGLEFFQLVADVAEAEGHHPDLHLVGWNNVKIDIWTHSVGGLTENDFILAAKISSLAAEHLMRKKPAAAN